MSARDSWAPKRSPLDTEPGGQEHYKAEKHATPLTGADRAPHIAPTWQHISFPLQKVVEQIDRAAQKAATVDRYCHGDITEAELSEIFSSNPDWRAL